MKNIDFTIEQYLQGNLSVEEVKAFEQELQSNPEIQSELSMQRNIIEAIKQTRRMEMKASLSKINPSYVSPLTQKIAIAAVSLLTVSLVGVGIYSTISKKDMVFYQQNDVKTTNSIEKNVEDESIVLSKENTSENISSSTIEGINQSSSQTTTNAPNFVKNTTSKTTTIATSSNKFNQSKHFDPLALGQDSNDDNDFSGKNGRIEIDKSANTIENSKVDYSVDSNYDFLGYKYDGKNLQLLGKFAGEAYIVEKKMNLLVLRYNNKIYQIIESNKVERLDKHQITNQKIIDQLK